MHDDVETPLDRLELLARRLGDRAHAPYSHQRTSAVLLLKDGSWIPGVRVENASFSLVISALQNALTTSVSLRQANILAVALNRPFTRVEIAFLETIGLDLEPLAPSVLSAVEEIDLPFPQDEVSVYHRAPTPHELFDGLILARDVARRAQVPESSFPVGALLQLPDGRLVAGCNVEYEDWMFTLCAERNAISTALSYGLTDFDRMYLTCAKDPYGTPCGACRQVMVEFEPQLELVMDRDAGRPHVVAAENLLPDYFAGTRLRHTF
jgi:homotetrameric cytidine deaminase